MYEVDVDGCYVVVEFVLLDFCVFVVVYVYYGDVEVLFDGGGEFVYVEY